MVRSRYTVKDVDILISRGVSDLYIATYASTDNDEIGRGHSASEAVEDLFGVTSFPTATNASRREILRTIREHEIEERYDL